MWILILLAYAVEAGAVLGVSGLLPLGLLTDVTDISVWVPVHMVACVTFALAIGGRARRTDRTGMTVMLFLFAAAVPPFGMVIATCMVLLIRRGGRRGVFDEFADYIKLKPAALGDVARLGEEVIERDLLTQPIVDVLLDHDRLLAKGAIDKLAMRNDAEAVKMIRGFLTADDDALRLHASAALLRIEGRLNDAIFEVKEWVKRTPVSAEGRVALAGAYLDFCNSGLPDEATRRHYMTMAAGEYEAALRLSAHCDDAVAGLARVRIDVGDVDGAVRMLEPAVRRNAGDVKLRLLLGEAYFALGRYAEVRSLLQEGPTDRPLAAGEAEALIGWWTQSEGIS